MASNDPAAGKDSPRRPVAMVFTSHWLAMFGLGVLLTAIVLWACLFTVQLRHGQEHPYIGLVMLGVGIVFVIGLVLTPLGLHLGRRRLRQNLADSVASPSTSWRRFFVFIAITSLANVAIASQLTFRAVHTMESRDFCTSCHVMTPEARSFPVSPHAGILCVDCHVGNGALGFIQSKLQGARQLWSVITDTVHKPIEGAITSGKMIPSAQTCEECHWKERPAKATLKLFQKFGEDVANTPTITLLTMNVGGSQMGGIHGAHHAEGVEIQFVAVDRNREEIPLVEYKNSKTGVSRTYLKEGADASQFAASPRITMQCFDCHNRPAHSFEMPDRAVDRALGLGQMPATLPFLKKTALEILKAEYASSAEAESAIPAALAAWYAKSQPEASRTRAAEIAEAGEVLAEIYSRNVFPDLGVTWGTYPNHNGHEDSPGCFRCHDGEHVTSTGEKISNECFRCHFPAAVEETNPEVLKLLGVDTMLRKLQKR